MHALEIEHVSKTFKNKKRNVNAVDDVSFTVNDGEVIGLLGMNGAGKSTTVKMCIGLLAPDNGSIKIFGHDIVTDAEAAKSFLNVSPQETAIAQALSVRENLELVSRIYGADKIRSKHEADKMLERFKLNDKADEKAKKLSGGLMRRLSVAMALITDPKLVFLDEPTLGLDIVSRMELWRFIKELKGNTAVVLTTHYLEEAEALCDRIVIMSDGRIVAEGTAEQLKEISGMDTFETAFLYLAGEEAIV